MERSLFAQSRSASLRLSRRRLLASLVAGGSALLLARGLAPAPARAQTPTPEPTPLVTTGAKGEIVISMPTNAAIARALPGIIERFTQQSGIGVKWEIQPQWSDAVNLITTQLASSYSGIDCYYIDDVMTATFMAAGWLEPLGPLAPEVDWSDWPESYIKDLSSWEGQVYRVPWSNDIRMWFYRKDWFEQAGLEPPTTWDAFVEAGKRLTRGEQFGTALPASKGGSLSNDIAYWTAQAGGAIDRLDAPGSKVAMEFYKGLWAVHKIAPSASPTFNYPQVSEGFQNDKYAMINIWNGFYNQWRLNERFWQEGKVGIFMPPKGPENNHTLGATWGWTVNKFTRKRELAAEWIKYAASAETLKAFSAVTVPARTSLLGDPEVEQNAPTAALIREYARAGVIYGRPMQPEYMQILDVAEESIHRYLTDQTDLDSALREGAEKIKQIKERARR